jgi:hypothetical protein
MRTHDANEPEVAALLQSVFDLTRYSFLVPKMVGHALSSQTEVQSEQATQILVGSLHSLGGIWEKSEQNPSLA